MQEQPEKHEPKTNASYTCIYFFFFFFFTHPTFVRNPDQYTIHSSWYLVSFYSEYLSDI